MAMILVSLLFGTRCTPQIHHLVNPIFDHHCLCPVGVLRKAVIISSIHHCLLSDVGAKLEAVHLSRFSVKLTYSHKYRKELAVFCYEMKTIIGRFTRETLITLVGAYIHRPSSPRQFSAAPRHSKLGGRASGESINHAPSYAVWEFGPRGGAVRRIESTSQRRSMFCYNTTRCAHSSLTNAENILHSE